MDVFEQQYLDDRMRYAFIEHEARMKAIVKIGEWQLCPKCNGSGQLPSHNTTNLFDKCDVCNGAKIIAKPIL